MTQLSEPRPSYFTRLDEHRFAPTSHAGGAWRDDEQHFSPLGGLLVHEIERVRAREQRPGLLVSRIGFDILGRIALEEFEIHVSTPRPAAPSSWPRPPRSSAGVPRSPRACGSSPRRTPASSPVARPRRCRRPARARRGR
ncbi:hypothetical protein [Amycolatopsis samaneae]|uniref:Uncharacterized protein n=1 Tax=Amycolatopsis samaneae TaxID=664691 RepID=A0ABW5GG83_9PSEU